MHGCASETRSPAEASETRSPTESVHSTNPYHARDTKGTSSSQGQGAAATKSRDGNSDRHNTPSQAHVIRHHDYVDVYFRRASFERWPRNLHRFPKSLIGFLAWAGFFYEGDADYVRCYECGRVLSMGRHCTAGQDPVAKHLERNPQCQHAQRLQKRRNDLLLESQFKTDSDEGGHPQLPSGRYLGLPDILSDRSRRGDGSSIDGSSGEQPFWPVVSQVHFTR